MHSSINIGIHRSNSLRNPSTREETTERIKHSTIMKKILIIYHRIDFDGLCSMAIVRHWAVSQGMEVDLLGYNHGDSDPVIREDYHLVFVLDVCLDSDIMVSLKSHSKLVWIDHHNTSILEAADKGFDNAMGFRVEGVGACELCWRFCHRYKATPLLVQLLSTYDVWDKFSFNWEKETLPFQFGMRNRFDLDVEAFYRFFVQCVESGHIEELVDEIMSDGKCILNYVRKIGKRACEAYGFEVDIDGGKVKGFCLLTAHFGALELEETMSEHGCKVAVCVNRHASSGTYKISAYAASNDLGSFNIGSYMKEHYNGGGHRCAAGGTLTEEQFLRLLNEHCL